MKTPHLKSGLVMLVLLMLQTAVSPAHNRHPLGKQELAWSTDTRISRTLAMNIDFHGGDWFVIWRQPGRVEQRNGRQCLVGPYFFFDVDDQFAFDIDETVTLELVFDRDMTDGFNLSYDHAVNPKVKSVRFSPDYEERWERVTLKLDHARFANRKYEKTDFAIGALGAIQPQPEDVNGELALCGLKISRDHKRGVDSGAKGTLALTVHNENNSPDSARVGLYDAQGRSPLPGGDAVTLDAFSGHFKQWPLISEVRGWPSDGRYVFYVDGNYRADVPEGDYDLVMYKGPEYRIFRQQVHISAGKTSRVDVKLQRWIDMPAKGWYSGDAHIHIARPDPSKNPGILAFTRAEDIHVSNLLQMGNVGSSDYFSQYAFGRDGDYIRSLHALVSGQESPRSSHRGHTIGLNATRYISAEKDYFVYDKIADQVSRDGGLWGYAHVAIDAFNVGYGLALDVPLGVVDFVEILQMGMLNTRYMYDFLNLGYKLLPAAGSDYPYIHVAGSERIYVDIDDTFSPQAWFEAWENRRSFVSNGPVIEYSVNGDSNQFEFDLHGGSSVNISARAAVNPDIDALSRLELVVHGNVVKSVVSETGAESLELSYDFQPNETVWLAIRAYGQDNRVAHTAPAYLYVDGNKRFWKRERVREIASHYVDVLNKFKASTPDPDQDWERADTEGALLTRWNADKEALDRRIDKALSSYRQLMAEATEQSPGAVVSSVN
jgi:hypothetical protein